MPILVDDLQNLSFLPALRWSAGYVALFLVAMVVLTIRVALQRRDALVGLGDGGNSDLLRRMRIHGNFCENAPFSIGALILLPLLSAQPWLIHLVGASALLGRALHAIGLTQSAGKSNGRIAGMMLTFGSHLIAAAALLALAWS